MKNKNPDQNGNPKLFTNNKSNLDARLTKPEIIPNCTIPKINTPAIDVLITPPKEGLFFLK